MNPTIELDNIVKSFFETNQRRGIKHNLDDIIKITENNCSKHSYKYYNDKYYLAVVKRIDHYDCEWINIKLFVDINKLRSVYDYLYKRCDPYQSINSINNKYLNQIISESQFKDSKFVIYKVDYDKKIDMSLVYPNDTEYLEKTHLFFSFIISPE